MKKKRFFYLIPIFILDSQLVGITFSGKKDVKVKEKKPEYKEIRPAVTLKGKDFIQSCGEAWQCIVCKKVLSNRAKAIIHIEDDHPSSLLVAKEEPDQAHSSHVWMCNICKSKSSDKEKAVSHLQKAHMITRKRAIQQSIIQL